MAARHTRPTPDKIHRSGKKFWEDLMYVQDEKKNTDWHPRHAYLAKFDGVTYLLTYAKEPTLGCKTQKPKEFLTLYTVVEGMAPPGFSKREDGTDMFTVGLQTQDPEGMQFVGLKKQNDLKVFVAKVKEALHLPPSIAPKPAPKPRPAQRTVALPARTRPNFYCFGPQNVREGDDASLGHLGESASSQMGVDPRYRGEKYTGHVLVANPGDLRYGEVCPDPNELHNDPGLYEPVYD